MPLPTSGPASTGLAITNPLILYRALLATNVIKPDPAQHRLALELQKLYLRLKDYSPSTEYGARLKAISRLVDDDPKAQDDSRLVAVSGHPLRRNPLFSHLFPDKQDRDSKALTRVLTSLESAISVDSPKGLLLHGEVGTGKSMLVDLLADSLPNPKKRRWHFNTFMLETLARLEQLRQSRSATKSTEGDAEYSLLWLARDMIDKSPILFLDEFQLPDRAASKILSNLFTTFFQLGGILVATSNRMPDELSKASGTDFAVPPRGGYVKSLLGLGGKAKMDMFPSNNEYGGFVEVLKARCEIWNMEGARDWRRSEAEEMDAEASEVGETLREDIIGCSSGAEVSSAHSNQAYISENYAGFSPSTNTGDTAVREKAAKVTTPKKYFLTSQEEERGWQAAIRAALPKDTSEVVSWQSGTILVYGRHVSVSRHLQGATYWTFLELCGGTFGPADYITLASTYHTLILDEVPILTLLQKNEARRFITLLDALYEARCKLLIRAAAGPDDLFFPETKATSSTPGKSNVQRDENDGGDAVYPETLSEIYQDQTSPFRPNVSSYTDEPRTGYDPDEDSDFGPLPGNGIEIGRTVNFGMTSSFTGDDERFAYKRARSRLWEMCGAKWHARSDPGWWRPLPLEVRRWEQAPSPTRSKALQGPESDVKLGESTELDRPAGLQGKEMEEREKLAAGVFREPREPPPKIGWAHAWGMMKWGTKAGPWGQGIEGLDAKKNGNGSR